jgi:hypothetical protein
VRRGPARQSWARQGADGAQLLLGGGGPEPTAHGGGQAGEGGVLDVNEAGNHGEVGAPVRGGGQIGRLLAASPLPGSVRDVRPPAARH